MLPKTRYFLVVLLIALPLDQLTKAWVISTIRYGERIPVIEGFFDLTHVRNPGGAFSFFALAEFEVRMMFFVGSTAVAIVLLLAFFRRLEPNARLAAIALGSVLGGALGNLIDRIVHYEVIDFIDIHLTSTYTWPTFNLADSFIVCGVAILLVEIFLGDESEAGGDLDSAEATDSQPGPDPDPGPGRASRA